MQEEGKDGRKEEDKHRTTLFRLGSFMHDASLVHNSMCGFHHIRVNPHTFKALTMHYARTDHSQNLGGFIEHESIHISISISHKHFRFLCDRMLRVFD